MEKTFEKTQDNKLVETITEEKVTVIEHDLDELIKIRKSIDVSETEYLEKSQAEKDKYDTLIAECEKRGVKTQEQIQGDLVLETAESVEK